MHWKIALVLGIAGELLITPGETVELITSAIGVAVFAGLYTGWQYGNCYFNECCDKKWIKNDFGGLQYDFEAKLHGQHLASSVVLKALRTHLQNPNPTKALVLSFHGRTGSGKNHVANLAVSRIYKLGTRSRSVKLWISKLHFPHEHKVHHYQSEIRRTIKQMVKFCARSFFIIDEADMLPEGVIDALKPFLESHAELDGVDYRKATFLFLSNTGSSSIAEMAFKFLDEQRKREDITMADIEPLVKIGSFNEKGGMHKSKLTENSLIDFYVPFLPLEKKHILLCIEDHLSQRGCIMNDELIKNVADTMDYEPPNIYSKTGCKTIEAKLSVLLQDECDK